MTDPSLPTTRSATQSKWGAREDAGKRADAGKGDATPSASDASAQGADASEGPGQDAGKTSFGADAGTGGTSTGETGRLIGITAVHNAVRAMVQTSPMLADAVWSPEVAAYAQQWADTLAQTACSAPRHRTAAELQKKGYGENLASFGATQGQASTAQQAVQGWAAEVACWTYGTIVKTEQCDVGCYTKLHSDGCGHYTQVVWRKSTELGCGVASCMNGQFKQDIWICNYSPAAMPDASPNLGPGKSAARISCGVITKQ